MCVCVCVCVCVQLLMIIRHGESEYNLACSKSRDYADPQIFDPKLTTTGINQVRHPLS